MEAKWSNKLLDIRQGAAEASEEPQRLRKLTYAKKSTRVNSSFKGSADPYNRTINTKEKDNNLKMGVVNLRKMEK